MRPKLEMIGKLGRRILKSVFSGLVEVLCGRGLDFQSLQTMVEASMELDRDAALPRCAARV